MVTDAAALIAIPSSPGADFAGALNDAWGRGDAVLPMDPGLPGAETARLLDELKPSVMLEHGRMRPLRGGAPVASGIALVVPTSGTTGPPKGVELSHDALAAAARASIARIGSETADRWLCCLPLNHIAGLAILVRSRLLGTEPVIHDRFDVAAIERASSANLVALVPTMLVRLLAAGVDLARFRSVLVGGDATTPELLERATRAGARLVTTYGLTETCGGVVYDGVALDGVALEISAEGEISISGPMLMNGYRGRPDLTSETLRDGWLHTSDLGEFDPGGRLRILGRADDTIITGGRKVSAGEVERVLRGHPQVTDVVVVGVPDAEWGHRVVAVVVPESPRSEPTLTQLRAFISTRCPAYKAPSQLVLVSGLPELRSGKRERAALARRLALS
jgi:O-succinylbenzoic acid--CoA ligase